MICKKCNQAFDGSSGKCHNCGAEYEVMPPSTPVERKAEKTPAKKRKKS